MKKGSPFWQRYRNTPEKVYRLASSGGDPFACWFLPHIKPNEVTGYVQVGIDGRLAMAHRVMFEYARGPLSPREQIDHYRMNPGPRQAPCSRACVNPNHIEAVSCKTNLMRGRTRAAENAARTECVNGHPFTTDNTAPRLRPGGGRVCRECSRRRTRDYMRRQAAAGVPHYRVRQRMAKEQTS